MLLTSGTLYVATATIQAGRPVGALRITSSTATTGLTHLWGCIVHIAAGNIKIADTDDWTTNVTAGQIIELPFYEPGSTWTMSADTAVYVGVCCVATASVNVAAAGGGVTGGTSNTGLTTPASVMNGTAIATVTPGSAPTVEVVYEDTLVNGTYPGARFPGADQFPGGGNLQTVESDPVEIFAEPIGQVVDGPSVEIFAEPLVVAPASPSVPVGLTAAQIGAGFVTLDWGDSTNMIAGDAYDVEIDGVVAVQGLITSGYTRSGLVDGVLHTYRVRAGQAGRYSAFSAPLTVASQAPVAPAPSVPTLTATGSGNGTVSLSWTASTGLVTGDTYQIEVDGVVTVTGLTGISTVVSGLANGVSHSFRVRAGATGRFSAFSNTVTATPTAPVVPAPSAPTGLTATAVATTSITLDWADSTGMQPGDGYDLERNGVLIATGLATSQYFDSGLTSSTTYTYRVRAGVAGRFSAFSSAFNATTTTSTPTPPEVVSPEQWTINGVSLNTSIVNIELGLGAPPAKQRQDWVTGADSEFSALSRVPLHENKTITGTLEIGPLSTRDAAFSVLNEITRAFQSASNTPDGVPLTWRPQGSTAVLTADVLAAEFTEFTLDALPMLNNMFVVPFTLTCKPYWRGSEIVSPAVTASAPIITTSVTVPGDVPALSRVIVKDAAAQPRRHVEIGVENQNFLPSSPTTLIIDSSVMTVAGYTGTAGSVTGFYTAAGGTSSGITGLAPGGVPTALCGVPSQGHNGRFRVKGRFTSAGTSRPTVRLAWQIGTGQLQANRWREFQPSGIRDVDLGIIDVPAGQTWSGRVDVYDQASGAGTVSFDYLMLIPTDGGYAKARTTQAATGGSALLAYDAFNGVTQNSVLSGRTVPLGGTWSGQGAGANDFTAQVGTGAVMFGTDLTSYARSTQGSRWALLGGSYSDVTVSGYVKTTEYIKDVSQRYGFVARYVDANNFLWAGIVSDPYAARFVLAQVVAGTQTVLAVGFGDAWSNQAWWQIGIAAYSSGGALARLYINGALSVDLTASSTALATGGALATGRVGIFDDGSTQPNDTIIRYYDHFQAATVTPEVVLTDATRSVQFGSSDTILIASSGAQIGRPPSASGARLTLQPGSNRVAVAARRQDSDTGADDGVTDATTLQVAFTPRYLLAPPGA
jgi:hypothetical protein